MYRKPKPKLGPPPLSAREKVLSEWRRFDWTAEEKAFQGREKTAGAIMPEVLDRLGLDRKRSETEIVKVWNHLIDPQVTAHAQPVGLRNGTLFVRVDSDVWKDEIVRYRSRDILRSLQTSFGKDLVARISFRVE